MCCSVFLFAQFITTKEILRINTYEKNIKDILFAKEVSNIQTSFLLKGE